MSQIFLDLIPLYILFALLGRVAMQRKAAILSERKLALFAALVVTTLWLLSVDALFTRGAWKGPGWIAAAVGLGLLIPFTSTILILKFVRGWAVLKTRSPQVLTAVEKALQAVRFNYEVEPPGITFKNPDGRLTVRELPAGFLWIAFAGNPAEPKLRLLKRVIRKFVVYGAPGATGAT